jgi:hypothetical protein
MICSTESRVWDSARASATFCREEMFIVTAEIEQGSIIKLYNTYARFIPFGILLRVCPQGFGRKTNVNLVCESTKWLKQISDDERIKSWDVSAFQNQLDRLSG